MTISLRGTVQTADAFPVNHTAISGLAADDLILDIACNHNGGTAPVFDSTYTFTTIATGTAASTRNYHYGRRVATGAETAMDTTSGATLGGILYLALQGIDTTTPTESYAYQENSFATACPFPASTPTTDNCWHILIAQDSSNTNSIASPPSGYTSFGSGISAQGALYVFYKDLGAGSSGVSTGAVSATWGTASATAAASFIVRAGASGPTVTTVSSNSATEGGSIVHTVTLSAAVTGSAASYAITLAGGTATGGGTDYTSTLSNGMFSDSVTVSGGNISVPVGVSTFTVTVSTAGDTIDEANETYTLTIGGTAGTGTINDDDAAPSISVNDVTESAGSCIFTVSLSAASGKSITVDYATANGTSTAGVDYTAASGTLTFAAGETTKTVTVTVP